MRALAGLALAAVLAATAPRAALAADAADIAGYLDDDATVVFRADPPALLEAIGAARKVNPEVATAVLLLSLGGRAIGIDLLSRSGWGDAGLDFDAPVMASVAALDMAAASAEYDALATAAAWDAATLAQIDRTWWRSRVALGVADATRFENTLKTLLGMAPFAAYRVVADSADDIAAMLNTRSSKGKAVVRALAKSGVLAVLSVPLTDQLAFVHRHGDVLLVDVISSFAGIPLDWDDHRDELIALLGRQPRRFAQRIAGTGAAAVLHDPGVSMWIDPGRLVDLSVARFMREALDMVAAGARYTVAPDFQMPCAGYREIADTGPFTDAAVSLAIAKSSIQLEVTWGLRAAYQLAASLIVVDDGLLRPDDVSDAVLAGGVHMAGFGALRALPRPTVLTGGAIDMWLATARCGPTALPVAAMFGWPQILGSLLDDVAGINDEAELVVNAARNVAFAAREIGTRRDDNVAAIEISFASGAEDTLAGWNDLVFGASRKNDGKTRAYTSWGRGPLRPYSWRPDGDPVVFGAGVGDVSVSWFLEREMASPGATSTIAWLELDAHKGLRQLGGLAALFDTIRRQLGGAVSSVSADLSLRNGSLVSRIDLTL